MRTARRVLVLSMLLLGGVASAAPPAPGSVLLLRGGAGRESWTIEAAAVEPVTIGAEARSADLQRVFLGAKRPSAAIVRRSLVSGDADLAVSVVPKGRGLQLRVKLTF